MTGRPTVLYLTLHGLASPLGRAQCLPYLLRLAEGDRARLLVISWESDPLPDEGLRRRVRDAGIDWVELRYHFDPKGFATLYDVFRGLLATLRFIRRERVDVLHARSYFPATVAWMAGLITGTPFVFDMLGMLADEYADIGHWSKEGFFYRATKGVERILLRSSAAVIVLTERSAEHLRSSGLVPSGIPIVVIPCYVDTERFRCASARSSDGPRTLIYAGGLGGWYLVEEMVAFFAVAREASPDLRLRVITRGDHALVHDAARDRGLPADAVEVVTASPDEMNRMYCAADAGLCLIAPMFSKHAASPNKFAEYLACGLPVIANAGVGDLDRWLERDDIGVVVRAFDDGAYREAWAALLEKLARDEIGLRSRCRRVAERDLAAERAVDAYELLWGALARPRA